LAFLLICSNKIINRLFNLVDQSLEEIIFALLNSAMALNALDCFAHKHTLHLQAGVVVCRGGNCAGKTLLVGDVLLVKVVTGHQALIQQRDVVSS